MATVEQRPAAIEEENPLVEGLERLPVHPTTLVIFGATGDLAQRKLLPALYNLAHEGALPERFALVGNARSEMTDEGFGELVGLALNRCFYRSTAPSFFPVIVDALGRHGLEQHEHAEVRVVIEKPF